MRACMASILELPLKHVPHFSEVAAARAKGKGEGDFWGEIYKWLDTRDLMLIHTVTHKDHRAVNFVNLNCYHLMGGPSPRDPRIWHSVVAYRGRMIHDPHPTRAGILDLSDEHPLRYYDFVVPKGVANHINRDLLYVSTNKDS